MSWVEFLAVMNFECEKSEKKFTCCIHHIRVSPNQMVLLQTILRQLQFRILSDKWFTHELLIHYRLFVVAIAKAHSIAKKFNSTKNDSVPFPWNGNLFLAFYHLVYNILKHFESGFAWSVFAAILIELN